MIGNKLKFVFTFIYYKQKAAVIYKEQITNGKQQSMYKCISNDVCMYDEKCINITYTSLLK